MKMNPSWYRKCWQWQKEYEEHPHDECRHCLDRKACAEAHGGQETMTKENLYPDKRGFYGSHEAWAEGYTARDTEITDSRNAAWNEGYDEGVHSRDEIVNELLEACEAVDAYLSAPHPENMTLKRRAAELVEQAIAKVTGEG